MLAITATRAWREAHSGAMIGLLELSGVQNDAPSLPLETLKRETEAILRARYQGYTRQDLTALPVMSAYVRYYKRFDKTYHVLLQLESLVQRGKCLPAVSPLVDASFAVEVDTLILTAGHDVDRLSGPVTVDVSCEGDEMTQMNGTVRPIRAGDMAMRDARGVCCTILYGQDHRSPITPATTHALYMSYVPPGIPAEAVEEHLNRMEAAVRLFSPAARLEQRALLYARDA
jgi:DNA/RNA-binding domain of Phe-tRNA-synthetase-like protein